MDDRERARVVVDDLLIKITAREKEIEELQKEVEALRGVLPIYEREVQGITQQIAPPAPIANGTISSQQVTVRSVKDIVIAALNGVEEEEEEFDESDGFDILVGLQTIYRREPWFQHKTELFPKLSELGYRSSSNNLSQRLRDYVMDGDLVRIVYNDSRNWMFYGINDFVKEDDKGHKTFKFESCKPRFEPLLQKDYGEPRFDDLSTIP